MPALACPWLRQTMRDRWRDALCNGDKPLPRRRHQHPALALAALSTAFVHLALAADAHGQSTGMSPFQPSLTYPARAQRFGVSAPIAGSTAELWSKVGDGVDQEGGISWG